MNGPDKILVFIPAYNCAKQIGRVLTQFSPAIVRSRFNTILVLDNRSTDETADVALAAARRLGLSDVVVARNRANYGLGGSHKAAFAYAAARNYTHVAVLHGDDQGRIADLLPVLDAGLHRTHDACLGSRFSRKSSLEGYSKFRTFGNLVFNGLFTLGTRRLVTDLGSGLNIFARRAFDDPRILTYGDDLRFNVFLLLGYIDAKLALAFFPISWREDDQVSNVKMTSQALRTLKLLSTYLIRRRLFRADDHRQTPRPSYLFDLIGATDTAAAQ